MCRTVIFIILKIIGICGKSGVHGHEKQRFKSVTYYFGIVDKGKEKVKPQKAREVPIAMIVYKLSCTGD